MHVIECDVPSTSALSRDLIDNCHFHDSYRAPLARPDDRSPFTPTYHFAIETYQGTEEPFIRIRALADLIAGLHGGTIDDSGSLEYAINENKVQALSCQATSEALGWRIRTPLDAGLTQLGSWYRARSDRPLLKQLMLDDLNAIVEAVA